MKKDASFTVTSGDQHFHLVPRFIHLGRVNAKTPWRYPVHTHDSYECILVTKGSVRFSIDGEPFTARAGDFYFLTPGQRHEETMTQPPFFFYYLKFHLCDIQGKSVRILPNGTPRSRQILRDGDAVFRHIFETMYDEVLADASGSREIIESMILELVWRLKRALNLIRQARTPLVSGHDAIIERAKQYIVSNITRAITLDELARHCNRSPDYLGHLFKRSTGVAPLAYASSVRIDEAKRMLTETTLRIAEIARKTGFEDAAYFSRKFKQSVRFSPEAFRRGDNR